MEKALSGLMISVCSKLRCNGSLKRVKHMAAKYDIGLEEALILTIDRLSSLQAVKVPVEDACGLVAAEDCLALVDCPSATASLKDGYAVVSADVEGASNEHPVRLKITGMIGAGDERSLTVKRGFAVKVMTGASIPKGADAVVAEEFTYDDNGWVVCRRDVPSGKNVLLRGSDVAKGKTITTEGTLLAPAMTGLLAAGGIHTVRVYPRPKVGIVSTGDEVVAPGRPIKKGQLYASNMVTLLSWLRHFRIEAESKVVPDQDKKIRSALKGMIDKVDVLLTSGGAWKSERDMTAKILVEMGGEIIFHGVRLGPGKAVALIMIDRKPVFCLPGGPPSNEMAFLQLVLPGLLRMAGRAPVPFGIRKARLSAPVGGKITWTQFFQAELDEKDGQWVVNPQKLQSRLQSQATANALIKVPEGVERLDEGEEIEVQVLF